MDFTNQKMTTSPQHLRRHDRTPEDPGYCIEFKNGRTLRHDFGSNEECQAYVASLDMDEKNQTPVVASAEAEEQAEKAAADLLAELDLEERSVNEGTKDEAGKRGDGKKRGKRKKQK